MGTKANERRQGGKRKRLLTIETTIEIRMRIPEDQQHWLPTRSRAPLTLPLAAPLPRVGEVVYLSSTSAWGVTMVIHQWRSVHELNIELWLEHVHASRHDFSADFVVTQ